MRKRVTFEIESINEIAVLRAIAPYLFWGSSGKPPVKVEDAPPCGDVKPKEGRVSKKRYAVYEIPEGWEPALRLAITCQPGRNRVVDDVPLMRIEDATEEKVTERTVEHRLLALERVVLSHEAKLRDFDSPQPDRLLPCWNCKSTVVQCLSVTSGFQKMLNKGPMARSWQVICPACDTRGPATDEESEARAAWNRRVTP